MVIKTAMINMYRNLKKKHENKERKQIIKKETKETNFLIRKILKWKSSRDGQNSRLDIINKNYKKLEDRSIETIQNKTQY